MPIAPTGPEKVTPIRGAQPTVGETTICALILTITMNESKKIKRLIFWFCITLIKI
jgi:hypothetical protein